MGVLFTWRIHNILRYLVEFQLSLCRRILYPQTTWRSRQLKALRLLLGLCNIFDEKELLQIPSWFQLLSLRACWKTAVLAAPPTPTQGNMCKNYLMVSNTPYGSPSPGDWVVHKAGIGNWIFTQTKAKPSVANMLHGMPEFRTVDLENLGLQKALQLLSWAEAYTLTQWG